MKTYRPFLWMVKLEPSDINTLNAVIKRHIEQLWTVVEQTSFRCRTVVWLTILYRFILAQ